VCGQRLQVAEVLEQPSQRQPHGVALLDQPDRLGQHHRVGAELDEGRAGVDRGGALAERGRDGGRQLAEYLLAAADRGYGDRGRHHRHGGWWRRCHRCHGRAGRSRRALFVDPERLTLERVRRQQRGAGAERSVQPPPVDARARAVEPPESLEHRLPVVAAGPQRRQPQRVIGQARPAESAQDRTGAQLDEDAMSCLVETPKRIREADRLARMAHPVVRLDRRPRAHELAGQVRGHRHVKRCEPYACERVGEAAQCRLDERRVKRARHADCPYVQALGLEIACQRFDDAPLARHDDGVGAVHSGECEFLRRVCNALAQQLRRAPHGHHRPFRG
jgi:hypothetical protein